MKTPHTVLKDMKALAAFSKELPPTIQNTIDQIVRDLESLLPKTGDQRHEGLSDAQIADLRTRFTYHAPKPGQPETYAELRREAHNLALLIAQKVPAGREQSSALTKLEEAVFWANAGIARHGK